MNIDNWAFKLMRAKVDQTFQAFGIQMECEWYRRWYQFWHDAVTRVDEEHEEYHDEHPEMCVRIERIVDSFTEDDGVFSMIQDLMGVANNHVKQVHESIKESNRLVVSTRSGVTSDMHEALDRLMVDLNSNGVEMNTEVSEAFTPHAPLVAEVVSDVNKLIIDHFEYSDKKQSYERWRDISLRNQYQGVYVKVVEAAFQTAHEWVDEIYEALQDVYDPVELNEAYEMVQSYAMTILFVLNEVHNLSLKTINLVYPALTSEELDVMRVKSKNHMDRVTEKVLHSGKPVPPILTEYVIRREDCVN